jgi:nucleotide-binding universal stress UspA family protein
MIQRRCVLVGVDDRTDAVWAARYAAGETVARGLDLILAYGYGRSREPNPSREARRQEAISAVRRAAAQVVVAPDTRLDTIVEDTSALSLLTRLAGRAELVVLGQHHLSIRERIPDESLAAQLSVRIPCPLVVVPADSHPLCRRSAPVVVALDGETDADSALAVAFDEAERRRVSVLALHAAPADAAGVVETGHADEGLADAERDIVEILAGWKADHPDVAIRTLVDTGDAAELILRASRDAGLMVVGPPHRWHGRQWSHSVANAVIKLARCPLMIAPPAAAVCVPAPAGSPVPRHLGR